jgi:hypothetical protein
MRRKNKVALLLVTLLALAMVWPGVGWALNSIQAVNDLKASGKMSNAHINHSVVDLVYVSEGSVTTHTYIGENETLTINTFMVLPQENSSATNKITRFMFELTNRYRPDTELPLSVSDDRNTVHAYTYGIMKDEAIWAVVNGLPDCLANEPIDRHDDDDNSSGGGGSVDNVDPWVDKYSPEQVVETIAASTFTLNSTTYTVIQDEKTEVLTMDVAPEIVDDRTFVPVRYLAYSLGVAEQEIKWDHQTQTVTISRDNTTLNLKIGSDILTVNNEQQKMDVAPYIKQGRTMLPARWIAEPLGAKVIWDEINQQVKLEITKEVTKQGQ